MFKEIYPRPAIRRSWAVWTAVLGAFGAGFIAGMFRAGAKPLDGTLGVMEFSFMLIITVVFGIKASKRTERRTANSWANRRRTLMLTPVNRNRRGESC